MVRVFWAECPQCGEEFHAHHEELRHTGIELLCPQCGTTFTDDEAASIRE